MPLDIAIGFIGAIGYALITGEDLTVSLLLLGAIFALLPDIDFLVSWMRKGSLRKVDHTHRHLLHHPVPFIAIGGLIVWLLAPPYVLLFMGLTLAHFVHDSIGVGWGIPWLSPMSRRHLKFFVNADNSYNPKGFVFWRIDELAKVIAWREDKNWQRNTYRRITFTAVLELLLCIVGIALALLMTRYL